MLSNRMSLGSTRLTFGARSILAALALAVALIAGATSQIELKPHGVASADRLSAHEDGDRRIVEPDRPPLVRSEGRPSQALRGKGPGTDKHLAFTAAPAQVTTSLGAPLRCLRAADALNDYLLLRTQNPRAPPAA